MNYNMQLKLSLSRVQNGFKRSPDSYKERAAPSSGQVNIFSNPCKTRKEIKP